MILYLFDIIKRTLSKDIDIIIVDIFIIINGFSNMTGTSNSVGFYNLLKQSPCMSPTTM